MRDSILLQDLINNAADSAPGALAVVDGAQVFSYGQLAIQIQAFAASLAVLNLPQGSRVAVYLENRHEFVVACFGTAVAGLIFVPINSVLKQRQLTQILGDSGAAVLLTSAGRLNSLDPAALRACPALAEVWLVDATAEPGPASRCWPELMTAPARAHRPLIDADIAAIFYTSGSTGQPKGVVLSHRNLVAGAKSVAGYLGNHAGDVLLAGLPLSFDAGFSQLTTAFHTGAKVVLLNYLLPRDLLTVMAREGVTGLTAVPPLYIQLAGLDWPEAVGERLRYFANTGGRLPQATLQTLRQRVPAAQPFLMYGLTEAFRSTYLPPEEIDRRPDSIGKAIPNVEILVLREDGSECAADEPGELVHRGALVAQGYWNDAEKTAERYRLLPGRPGALQLPEYAVFSGDTVRRDADGFLYFVGRRDEMMKTSGYRVSPTEVEELLYATGRVGECIAFGVEHASLGQVIQVIATPPVGASELDLAALQAECRQRMPSYMVPAGFEVQAGPLPRNPNGKIDRKRLSTAWLARRDNEGRHEL